MAMNNFEKWIIQDINQEQLQNLHLENISYSINLNIVLVSDTQKIILTFDRFVSYRICDESYLLEYWSILDDTENNGYTFYKVQDSTYFEEMSFLSKDFFTDGGPEMIDHYAIFLLNNCIEVISDLSPTVKVTPLSKE